MPDLFKIYRALLRTAWATALEYRAQAVLWILSSIFPLVMMVVWLAVVREAGPITGWGSAEFASYYVGAALVHQLTFAWSVWQWDDDIRTGGLSAKLLKPLDPFHYLLTEQLGWKLFVLATLGPLVIALAALSPLINYSLTLERLAWFGLSVAAGFSLSMLMCCAFGVLAFWSAQVSNLYQLWFGVGQFLSGWIAPLALFPPAIRDIAGLLPFRYTLGFPMEILLGQLSPVEIGTGFAVCLAWGLVFLGVYRGLWRLGLRRYEAVGA